GRGPFPGAEARAGGIDAKRPRGRREAIFEVLEGEPPRGGASVSDASRGSVAGGEHPHRHLHPDGTAYPVSPGREAHEGTPALERSGGTGTPTCYRSVAGRQ